MFTPDAYTIQPESLAAPQALALWQTLIFDLDDMGPHGLEPDGDGPMHTALFALEAAILGYAPATAGEAYAIVRMTDHDLTRNELELGNQARAARARALRFLGELPSGKEAVGHGH